MRAGRVLLFLDRWLFSSVFTAAWAARTVRTQIENADAAYMVVQAQLHDLAAETHSRTLDRLEEQELERLRSIEEKAKAALVGVTLSISIIAGFATALFEPSSAGVSAPVRWSLLIATVYFLVGGAAALRALEVGRVYRLRADEYAYLSDHDQIERRLSNLVQNGRVTLLRSNAVSVSFGTLLRGVLALGVGVGVGVGVL